MQERIGGSGASICSFFSCRGSVSTNNNSITFSNVCNVVIEFIEIEFMYLAVALVDSYH